MTTRTAALKSSGNTIAAPKRGTVLRVRKYLREIAANHTCAVQFEPQSRQWTVVTAGSSKPHAVFSTKTEAVKFAREFCKNNDFELVVHGRDGRIRYSRRHGLTKE